MQILIIGGSFNPFHRGHLQMGLAARKQHRFDQIWYMPSKTKILKQQKTAHFIDRCNMIAHAIKGFSKFYVCSIENELSSTYTIDVLRELVSRYPNNKFAFCIGFDQALQFDKWHQANKLCDQFPIYVVNRGESRDVKPPFLSIPMKNIDVSSSEIRSGIKHEYVTRSTKKYIATHGLYFHEMLKQCVSENRYLHSCSVAKVSHDIARSHHLNAYIAYLAGLLHDVCKEMTHAQAVTWMQNYKPKRLQEPEALWHAYIGAHYIKNNFHVKDKRIVHAIYHHVKGDGKSNYDKILYIADKLDPLRGHDNTELLQLCKDNLNEGYKVVKAQQNAFLLRKGVKK